MNTIKIKRDPFEDSREQEGNVDESAPTPEQYHMSPKVTCSMVTVLFTPQPVQTAVMV